MNNDPKRKESIEQATERAQADVHNETDVQAAGHAQMEAERKQPNTSHKQAQAREAGAAKEYAEKHDQPKERANAEQARQQSGWRGEAEPHDEETHRQEHERLQPLEKGGTAEKPSDSHREDGYDYTVTEQRMDAFASAATPDSPEARANEAGPTDNIAVHGAYSDNPDEVDQISGPPMESLSKDKVERR
jgi:hypothetical protein